MNKFIMVASVIILLVCFWNRNRFPEPLSVQPQLLQEPNQKSIRAQPIKVELNQVQYQIQPLYDYELYGMVVSYQHHDGNSMLHKLWNDHLNMMDVCVIWGTNLLSAYINQLTFWNGQFTCNVQTRSNEAWALFDMAQISNNHLISENPLIRKQVGAIKIGDQIRIRGRLSEYQNNQGGKRGTSTTRTDTGNGACETIYVDEIDIIQPMQNGWRWGMWASLVLLLGSLGWHMHSPLKVK